MKASILLLFALLILSINPAQAQRQAPVQGEEPYAEPAKFVVTFAPLGLLNKMRAKAELAVQETPISVGVIANVYYGLFPGYKASPFVRYYFSERPMEGWFLQAKASAGMFVEDDIVDGFIINTNGLSQVGGTGTFYPYGGGFAGGHQWLLGTDGKIAIDIYLGGQLFISNSTNLVDTGFWYFTGPGSLFNTSFGVGIGFI